MGFFEVVGILFYKLIGAKKPSSNDYTIETRNVNGIKIEYTKDRR